MTHHIIKINLHSTVNADYQATLTFLFFNGLTLKMSVVSAQEIIASIDKKGLHEIKKASA